MNFVLIKTAIKEGCVLNYRIIKKTILMEAKAVVCTIAGILGLISAVLGFAAEATKVKASQITADIRNDVCIYPSSPSSVLGFVSSLALVVAFITINSAGGCFCCYKAKRCECGAALVCFIFSWLAFVPGVVLMLGAAALSRSGNMSRLRAQDNNYYYYDCYYVKPGVFAAAACLSLLSVVLGIAYYRNMTTSARPLRPNAHIETGQPHVPT